MFESISKDTKSKEDHLTCKVGELGLKNRFLVAESREIYM